MPEHSIYQDIAERTGGDVYIGVVGPVRTGKSTFIKRFMEALVLPNIGEGYSRERARDEMPQSAAGKTVMTTEPKFIPDEAVPIQIDDCASFDKAPAMEGRSMIMFLSPLKQSAKDKAKAKAEDKPAAE